MDGCYERFLHSLGPRAEEARKQMRPLFAKSGRVLLGRGSISTEVYFIREGSFGVVAYSPQGREVSLRTLMAGDVIGELSAVDGQPRSATVIAETDARVSILSREQFLGYVRSSGDTAIWLAELLAGKVRDMNERIFELSALNVQARLHCELLRRAKSGGDGDEQLVIRPAPRHLELANRIGTHREAVTREMNVLERSNVIRRSRDAEGTVLEFVDVQRLERFVGQAVGE